MAAAEPTPAANSGSAGPKPGKWWPLGCCALPLLLVAGGCLYELRTSAVEARALAAYCRSLGFGVAKGPSPSIAFPADGPFDRTRGYPRIPDFETALAKQGFTVAEQVRQSQPLVKLIRAGLNPPYREPSQAGLLIRASDGTVVFDAREGESSFASFEEIPPIVVSSLLFVENRELGMPSHTSKNPAVEWDRLLRGSILYLASKAGLPVRVEGGSSLAVQLEKFRHSPRGRTSSGLEKLRQLLSASLKAYRDGTDTLERRREIVLDYLNTMPLGAARGYGELFGLGEGLFAWFGLEPDAVFASLREPQDDEATAGALKHVLALLVAVKAPTTYLRRDSAALEARLDAYVKLLGQEGIVSPRLAELVRAVPLNPLPEAPRPPQLPYSQRKGANSVRTRLLSDLAVGTLYDLDRLHLEVDTTLDLSLQRAVRHLFAQLSDRHFVAARGLDGHRLLANGDPSRVLYSLLLVERTAAGNVVRVQTDSLDQPFDLNQGMKLELGSTGKLRTLAHYLEVVAELHQELSGKPVEELWARAGQAADPITLWATSYLAERPRTSLDQLLEHSLDRRYAADPDETFFTGGGEHRFHNFDPEDDLLVLSVREATWRSTNLIFLRLMRDLVRYHTARLPYDARAVLADPDHSERQRLLAEEGDAEARAVLYRFYKSLRNLDAERLERVLVGARSRSLKRLSLLFYAWHPGSDEASLGQWLQSRMEGVPAAEVQRLHQEYGDLSLADLAYHLRRHPLEVWCAGMLASKPEIRWRELAKESDAARKEATQWLLDTRHGPAQELRLRIRIEKDGFARMTPAWQRLGFPFDRLVPSLATAIGASGDRPTGLADLMGILVADGVYQPATILERLSFASGTPYATVLVRQPGAGQRVLPEAVARALRGVLVGVVERGTAGRLAGTYRDAEGKPLPVGGKTGSGDNRYKTFSRDGELLTSKVVNRTATFIFFIGDRFFGVLTAYVPGQEAEGYTFTSTLPVAILRLLEPELGPRLLEAAPLPAEPSPAPVASSPAEPTLVASAAAPSAQ